MNKAPRASLSITILDDEDYRILMDMKTGMEAFGTFVVMVIVGRERLQQGQARQMSGSDSLSFDNSLTHVLSLGHVTRKQFDRCLAALNAVASETNSAPWMHINKDSRLVIRSFFKFNASASWGGPRLGSGRPARQNQDAHDGNQDDYKKNQVDSNLEPSWVRSSTDSDSNSNSAPPNPPPGGGAAGGAGVSIEPEDPEPAPTIPAKVRNHPDDVARVVENCRDLWPANGWSDLARIACNEHPAAWVKEAMQIAAADPANPARSWRLVETILARFDKQGGPDSGQAKPSANGRPAAAPSDRPELKPWVLPDVNKLSPPKGAKS